MIRGFLLAVLVVALCYALAFVAFVSFLPPVPQGRPRADGIVALTGGGERLDKAVALFESGVGKRLLISGAAMSTTKQALKALSGGGRRFDCCADIGYAAEDTHGNAQEAADWARNHGFHSLIIVTARYHMPRAMTEFRAAMPHIALVPYPVEQDSIDLGAWWRHPRTAELLNREFAKYLASLVVAGAGHA